MAETSKNKIYYNDNENSVADVLADMKKMAESTDKAIENSKYNDAQIKKDISDAKKEQALKDAEQDNKIIELQNEKAKLEKELKEAQEDFYQNSIRGQASGEYIHVEDSSNCRARIGISGNHEQEMRSGKNYLNTLAKYKAGEKVTVDGITYIFNEDGSITCNGTATADSVLTFSSELQTINGSSKKIVGMLTGTQVPKKISILAYTSDWSKNTFTILSNVNKNITTNMQENIDYTIFRIIVYKETTLNNQTIYYQILDTSVNDLTYEQYGASPSPDYRSKVVAVGSNVNLLENTLKSQIINGIDVKVQDNGEIVLNGTATDNFILVIGKINKIKNMTFSGMCDGYGYNKMILQIQGKDYNVNVVNSNQITLSDLDTEATVRLYIYKGTSVINAIIEPKIVEGTEVGEYSKYGQGSVKVTKYNKNIFKETYNRKDLTSAYFSIVKGEGFLEKDKTYVISFDTTNNGGIVYLGEYSFQHINTYTVKCDGTRKFFTAKAKEFGYVTDITVLKTRAVTTNAYNISNVMINEYENDTDIDYVQHEEQSYIIPTQKEMLQGDYFDFDNEEEVHTWTKLVLNGTEPWGKSSNKYPTFWFSPYEISTKFAVKNGANGLCNYFEQINSVWEKDTIAFDIANITTTHSNVRFCLGSNSTITTLEEWKSKLEEMYNSGQPLIVYIQLRTPENLKFTDEQKAVAKELNNARTYKNVTNITTDSKAILSLDYAKDQETQNQKMQNEIDEIKQLLSTTQTSALLLDNMQTDIESEVK